MLVDPDWTLPRTVRIRAEELLVLSGAVLRPADPVSLELPPDLRAELEGYLHFRVYRAARPPLSVASCETSEALGLALTQRRRAIRARIQQARFGAGPGSGWSSFWAGWLGRAAPPQPSVSSSWAPTMRSWMGIPTGQAPAQGALQPAQTEASRSSFE